MVEAAHGTAERRGSRRALMLAVAAAGLALFSLFGLWWGWLERTPTANIPQPLLPAENAHDHWNAATTLLSATQEKAVADALLTGIDPPAPPRGSKGIPPLRERAALVETQQAALDRFRQGLPHPYLEPPARSYTHTFPHFAQYRCLARLLRLEGQVRAARGDWSGAMQSSLDSLQMGTEIPHGNCLIGALAGIAIQAIARQDTWEIIPHLSPREARAALARVEKIRAREFPFWRTLEEEKWLTQATLLDMMRKPNWRLSLVPMLVGAPAGTPSGPDQLLLTAQMATSSKTGLFEGYSGYMDQYIALAKQPSTLPPAQVPLPTNTVARMLAPVLHQARFSADRTAVLNGLLHLNLALRVYHADRGTYPASLDELAPRYVKTLPTDAFGGDKPFRYRRTLKGFMLYSLGPDYKDDNGRGILDHQGRTPRIPGSSLEPNSLGDIVVASP